MRWFGLSILGSGCLSQLPDLERPCDAWPDPGLFRLTLDEPSEPSRKPHVYVPSASEGPRDLVFLLHGAGATGPKMEEVTEFEKLADREGFVLVYPNGLGWPTRTWNAGDGFGNDHDDLRFLDDLLAVVSDRVCGGRSLATGFSNGAMMIHRWACEGKRRPDAIAPVSGTLLVGGCETGLIPVRHYHGTDDRVVPPEGGAGSVLRDVKFASVEETMDTWRQINGCTAAEPSIVTRGDTSCSAWDCATPTELCWVDGWDHHWPGGIRSSGTDANATGEIWAWFDEVVPLEIPAADL